MKSKLSFFVVIVFSLSTIVFAEELKITVKPQPQAKKKVIKIDKQNPDEKNAPAAKGPLRLPLKHFK